MQRLNFQFHERNSHSQKGASVSSYQTVPTEESYQPVSSSHQTPFVTPSPSPFATRQRSSSTLQKMSYQQRSDSAQRAALISGFKRQPIGKSSEADRHAAQVTADLEAQNDELLSEMHNKVLGLKEIALGMKEQVRESNSLLDKMGSAMTVAGSLLGTTMTRLQNLTSYRTGRHIWFMMLFFVGMLFLMYLLFKKR